MDRVGVEGRGMGGREKMDGGLEGVFGEIVCVCALASQRLCVCLCVYTCIIACLTIYVRLCTLEYTYLCKPVSPNDLPAQL